MIQSKLAVVIFVKVGECNSLLPQDVFGEFLKKAGFERPQLLFYFVKIYCLHSQKNDPIARFYPEVKARTPKF